MHHQNDDKLKQTENKQQRLITNNSCLLKFSQKAFDYIKVHTLSKFNKS